jgi:hypothetical protein
MLTAMRRYSRGLLALQLVGCGASSTPVNGPDGEPGWYSISCKRDQTNCEEEAGQVCPHGYVTANAGGQHGTFLMANWSGGHGSAFAAPTYQGHMLIKCKSDGDGPDDFRAARSPGSDKTSQPASQKDYALCRRDYASIDAMAATWADWFGGDPLDAPPSQYAFLKVCGDLPEEAQTCLSVPFASGHRQACIDTIRGLPPDLRHAVDRLFVNRPAG